MAYIKENLETKVTHSFDVVVAGGGIAGISAALSSAREGKSTVLIEPSYVLGGLATSGIVTIYLPLCDGEGHQVSFGICEELIRLSVKHGAEGEDAPEWFGEGSMEERKKHRYRAQFNPHLFALEAEKLLLDEGVTIFYGTRVCAVDVDSNNIKGVIVENKSGRSYIQCKAAVDATGDADLFYFAGDETVLYEKQNVLAAWYYYVGKEGVQTLNPLGYCESPGKVDQPTLIKRRFTGIDGFDNSEMVQLAHQQMLNDIIKRRQDDDKLYPSNIPSIPQLRMTRMIDGEYKLDLDDKHKHFESSVGMISDWRYRGPIYEVPFEALYTKKLKNVFAAGRCISVTQTMWDASRVIPPCAVTGEAAGIAAAVAAANGSVSAIDVQNVLKARNVPIFEKELDI